MVHPAVPCFLFTPICPHSLSSRPLVLPEHVALRVKVGCSPISKTGATCAAHAHPSALIGGWTIRGRIQLHMRFCCCYSHGCCHQLGDNQLMLLRHHCKKFRRKEALWRL